LPPEVLKAKTLNLFSKKGMKWLMSLEWAREEDKRMVESHLRVMEAITREFLDKAKVAHITKPLDIEVLKKMINNILMEVRKGLRYGTSLESPSSRIQQDTSGLPLQSLSTSCLAVLGECIHQVQIPSLD
jgi:hypothetical protein